MKTFIKKIIPQKTRKFIRRIFHPLSCYLLFGYLKPLSNYYGFDRGTPLDRYFIESFLEENGEYIHGKVLEVHDNAYTVRFGKEKVIHSDVIDINIDNSKANIHADLRNMLEINDNTYDCIILTQVLQFIDTPERALNECSRILKPDGVVLATLPCLSRVDVMSGEEADYWRFTKAGAKFLFKNKNFMNTKIESLGNARSGMLFWVGASCEEVSSSTLNYCDKNFPVIITIIAKK